MLNLCITKNALIHKCAIYYRLQEITHYKIGVLHLLCIAREVQIEVVFLYVWGTRDNLHGITYVNTWHYVLFRYGIVLRGLAITQC